MAKNNRKKFLIYPQIQLPLIYMSLSLVLMVTVLNFIGLVFFLFRYRYGDVDFQWGMIQDILFNIFWVHSRLLLILLIPFLIILGLFYRYFTLISNKFAGPIYKIEKELDQVIKTGEYSPIEIRSTDLLVTFVDKLNSSFKKIQKR